jgi:hypothetical protein
MGLVSNLAAIVACDIKPARLASACEGAQRGPRLPQHAARVRAVAVR